MPSRPALMLVAALALTACGVGPTKAEHAADGATAEAAQTPVALTWNAQGPRAERVGATWVLLEWTPPGHASAFRVERDGSPVRVVGASTYLVTRLAPDASYSFSVRARFEDGDAWSEPSPPVVIQTLPARMSPARP
jgi:hypothetical protein